ncbi:type II toxin-antitoxin system RelE/ParE family toxin [Candidatus Methylobacter oryzae]|uniref:Type II toxin-antitoxin system RelE/ParE family toxin n=1 Tax=Candidatus Methylobacter oryzae TaxID=2497749 RepID=A0ABY3CKH1_9GAMM|nr:type II toxin-antitoxin system RelE/ParE family toxin [Candidatus Methylobacter oryzae]TRX02556.1 type II toxin-antitoxin system RelE/ParE family toxin [Candidatus Methylobacter oryzae]
MKFFLHPQAQEELEQTILFYKQQQVGLEKRFIEAVQDAINRACRNPLLYRKIDDDIRKCRLLHFPYAVIFRIKPDLLEIIAIMHLRKQPNYWQSRK